MWTCAFCEQEMPANRILDHYRLLHPDDFEKLEVDVVDSWPDGEPLIYEDPDEQEWM